MDEWRRFRLEEITENYDELRKPIKESDRSRGPYPYYGASGVIDYVDGFLFDGDYLLVAEDGENLRTRKTPIAFLARGKFWVNNHTHVVRGGCNSDTRFLLYALNGSDISGYLTGAVMPKLTQSNLNKIELNIPPLNEQRAISHVLGVLDDKIELNRKQNETLEAMARAMFKAWFVDFEPVRAKMEGRWKRGQSLPGMPAHIYDLFPDRMVESELGEIPEGWRVPALREVCSYISRGISPKYIDVGGVAVVNQKCIRDFSIDFSKIRRHDASKRKIDDRLLKLWDVLVNSTGVGTLGRVAQVRRLPEATIVDSHVTVLRSGVEINPLYLGLVVGGMQQEIEALAEGSTGQTELSRAKLGELKILLPKNEVLDSFHDFMKSIFDGVSSNQIDSDVLARIRDTLLSELVSGRLRVPVSLLNLRGAL